MVILVQIVTYYTLKGRPYSHKSSDIIGCEVARILSEPSANNRWQTWKSLPATHIWPWIVLFYRFICYIILCWGYIRLEWDLTPHLRDNQYFYALSVNHIQQDRTQGIPILIDPQLRGQFLQFTILGSQGCPTSGRSNLIFVMLLFCYIPFYLFLSEISSNIISNPSSCFSQ